MAVSASLQQGQDSSSTHIMILPLSLASEALLTVEHYGRWVCAQTGRNVSGLTQVVLHLNQSAVLPSSMACRSFRLSFI